MKYSSKPIDPYKNIMYGSTDNEEFTVFDYEERKDYPIRVEMVGITNPDPNYFIFRKNPHYFVIEYVESGEGYVEVIGERYEVESDCVYILSPGISHKYGSSKLNPYRKIWINCFSSFLSEFLVSYGLENVIVFKNTECKKYFEEMLNFAREKPYNEDYSLGISKILFKIFFTLCEKNSKRSEMPNFVQKAKQLLDGAIYRKVTIEQIASEVNVSKSQLMREFKKYYLVTPYKYLLNKKLNIAKQFLLHTKMKVLEISDALCFSDEYNFSNIFKLKVGISPLEFRKREGKI